MIKSFQRKPIFKTTRNISRSPDDVYVLKFVLYNDYFPGKLTNVRVGVGLLLIKVGINVRTIISFSISDKSSIKVKTIVSFRISWNIFDFIYQSVFERMTQFPNFLIRECKLQWLRVSQVLFKVTFSLLSRDPLKTVKQWFEQDFHFSLLFKQHCVQLIILHLKDDDIFQNCRRVFYRGNWQILSE